ncbi:MAG TPA: DUF4124 domain-containing protein [Luteimonas sp.]|nr:DUF4124 domain-containing protein [Luteimonas sp.]HRO27243.1 DUF4124 domain-containing protein [Luteimonas sp.]HRP73134.1 DUF4124 domain-containing protein [Luteimonas sp.]
MRLGWALVAGAVGAGVLAWWLTRADEPPPAASDDGATATQAPAARESAGPVLYRWRDEAGVVQVTDVAPKGRDYTLVDVAALERRNTIEANPAIEAAR